MITNKKKIPRGIRNNNPLNLRVGNNWIGEVGDSTDPTFEQFTEMKWGVRAAFMVLRNYIVRLECNTLRKIISRWAPPSENNTEKYIESVSKLSGIRMEEKIPWDEYTLIRLFNAMCFVENGMYIDWSTVQEGWLLAHEKISSVKKSKSQK